MRSQYPVSSRRRDAVLPHLHAEEGAPVHGRGERLGPAHAAQPRAHDDPPGERAAEVLPRQFGEGLVGALQDPLRADVDPRPGRHLPVHREAQRVEAAELVHAPPARHEVRVRDQDAGGFVVGPEHPHRLPALHEERLVVLQTPQRLDDLRVARPIARRLARASVHDEVVGALGHGRVEVVHQHPEGRFLVPALAGEGRPARRVDGSGWLHSDAPVPVDENSNI